jgi:hypothetical protein
MGGIVHTVVCSQSIVLRSQSFGRSSVRVSVQAVIGSWVRVIVQTLASSFFEGSTLVIFRVNPGELQHSLWVVEERVYHVL